MQGGFVYVARQAIALRGDREHYDDEPIVVSYSTEVGGFKVEAEATIKVEEGDSGPSTTRLTATAKATKPKIEVAPGRDPMPAP